MKKIALLILFIFTFSMSLFSETIEEKIANIATFLKQNNLTIYKDSSLITNNNAINYYLNELINRMGKSSTIDFLVRTKKNGIYKTVFMVKDNNNSFDGKLLGNIFPVAEQNNTAVSYYPIQNMEVITLLFRFKEKEELALNDNIYLLNSMLYKDSTLDTMIKSKIENGENKTTEETERIKQMTKDLLLNKLDIIEISKLIIGNYEKEIKSFSAKKNMTAEDTKVISEDKDYIAVYQQLIDTMNKQLNSRK